MLRRRQTNANSGGRIARFGFAIADAVRRPFESLGRPFSRIAELIAWPFERIAWGVERRIVWPLRERMAGWLPPGRIVGAGALAAVAAAAVAVGVLLSEDNGGGVTEQGETRVGVVAGHVVATTGKDEPEGPALQGVPPSFGVGKGVGVAKEASGSGDGSTPSSASADAAPEAESTSGSATGEEAATASTAKPVPAGPAAMKVARRFAEAFVFYEVGKRPARAKVVFGETATPQLAEALAERPPRLPQGAEVPRAKVVNLVPGPRRGKAYTVSASLLRVGLTSELRLEMKRQDGLWRITDVRG